MNYCSVLKFARAETNPPWPAQTLLKKLPLSIPAGGDWRRKGESALDGHQLRTLREERSVVKKRLNFELSFRRYEVERGRDDCIAAATKG